MLHTQKERSVGAWAALVFIMSFCYFFIYCLCHFVSPATAGQSNVDNQPQIKVERGKSSALICLKDTHILQWFSRITAS
ncbi:MAG: hypothetical protein ACMUIU_06955 [bacterium]